MSFPAAISDVVADSLWYKDEKTGKEWRVGHENAAVHNAAHVALEDELVRRYNALPATIEALYTAYDVLDRLSATSASFTYEQIGRIIAARRSLRTALAMADPSGWGAFTGRYPEGT